jgi:hypothetical protein
VHGVKRYTAILRSDTQPPETKWLKTTIEENIRSIRHLSHVRLITQRGDTVLIEIHSEMDIEELERALGDLDLEPGMDLLAVEWGWAVTGTRDAGHEPIEIGWNLNLSSPPQEETSREYRAGMSRFIVLLVAVLLLIVGVLALLSASEPLVILFFLCLCLYVFFGLVVNGRVFSIGLIHYVTGIECSQQGLKARYLLRPPLYLAWDRIYGMRIRYTRSVWCEVQASGVPKLLPLVFPVTAFYAPKDAPTLVATIAERASLRLVEYSNLGDALFRRVAPPR